MCVSGFVLEVVQGVVEVMCLGMCAVEEGMKVMRGDVCGIVWALVEGGG